MGIFDLLLSNTLSALRGSDKPTVPGLCGLIPYGKPKLDGSHDHRYDVGNDRTPSQKVADELRRKK